LTTGIRPPYARYHGRKLRTCNRYPYEPLRLRYDDYTTNKPQKAEGKTQRAKEQQKKFQERHILLHV